MSKERAQVELEAKALLAAALRTCAGEHEDWDKWARAWVAGEHADARGMERETRGFREGMMVALGITWHDHTDAAFGDAGPRPPKLSPRHARARAREDVTRAIARAFAMKSEVTRALGLLHHAAGTIAWAQECGAAKGSVGSSLKVLPRPKKR